MGKQRDLRSAWSPPTAAGLAVLGVVAFVVFLAPNASSEPRPGREGRRTLVAARGPLAGAVAKLVKQVREKKGKLSLAVREMGSGRLLAEHQSGQALNPASNIKIITAWAALRTLGPQHRFVTSLKGDLGQDGHVPVIAIRGDGDPDLEVRHLYEMVARMKRAGLRSIGDILVDQSAFDDKFAPPAFAQQPGEWASFRAPVAPVSLAGNTVMFELRPGAVGKPARLRVVPAGFVTVKGQARTSTSAKRPALRLSLKADGRRLAARLGGTTPVDAKVVRLWRRVEDPTLLAGYGLRAVCADLGIEVKGVIKPGKGRSSQVLSRHRSRPLARLLHPLGKYSNNFYAEMIFKRLGVSPDSSEPASFSRAVARVQALMGEAKLDMTGFRLQNGSGLFDANRISAALMTSSLRAAYRDRRVRAELVSQLAIGGVDGTLGRRFKSLKKARMVRAKTGTLNQVSALSGYIIGKHRALSFSVLIDEVSGHAAAMRPNIDAFVHAVAAQLDQSESR